MGLVLTIHRGLHTGAKLPLTDGEYNLGASEECDIILADPGLMDHHCKLRVAGGDVFLLVYDGADAFVGGTELGADEVQLEHFQVVRLAGAAFRIGPEDAEWPALPDAEPTVIEAAETDGQAGASTGETAKPAPSAADTPPRKTGMGAAVPGIIEKIKANRRLSIGAGAAILLLLLSFLIIGGDDRAERATALLEERGFSIAPDGKATALALAITPEKEELLIHGSVDTVRQLGQIERTLAENNLKARLEINTREENLLRAEEWIQANGVPLAVRVLGKTRAAVYGYAQDADAAAEVFIPIKDLLVGFEQVNSEIINWAAANKAMTDVLAPRGLGFLELAPGRYHIEVTGLLNTPEEKVAWAEARRELATRLNFEPRFERLAPPEEYLRLVREQFSERRIMLEAALPTRLTMTISGFVKDQETADRALAFTKIIMDDWKKGALETDFTFWPEVETVLNNSLTTNGLSDVQLIDVGDYQVFLQGDVSTPERAEAWARVESDLAIFTKHAPAVVLRPPPPPEDAWYDDAVSRLTDIDVEFTRLSEDKEPDPTQLSLIKGKGRIRLVGAVENREARRMLEDIADAAPYPVSIEVRSRDDALETARRLLADKGAAPKFERIGATRLAIHGFVRDVEAGEALMTELAPIFDVFGSVEANLLNWAVVRSDFLETLKRRNLGRIRIEPLDYGLEADGALADDDETEAWNEALAALEERIGATVPVTWLAPRTPDQALPSDVVARLRELGMDPLLLDDRDTPNPMGLSVQQDGPLIRVTGIVEKTADKRAVQGLFDEGMRHLSIDLAVREEMLRDADRFLAELEIPATLERIGAGNVLVRGYALDMPTGEQLVAELKTFLTGFSGVEPDLTYWVDLRSNLAEAIKESGLQKLAVLPGEFEIYVIGKPTEDEQVIWSGIETEIAQIATGPVRFIWHEKLPNIRPGRLARRRGHLSGEDGAIAAAPGTPPQAAGAVISATAALAGATSGGMAALDFGGVMVAAAAKAAEEEAMGEEETRIASIRLAEVRPEQGGGFSARLAGGDRWFREGESVRGLMLVEVFREGMMLMKDANIYIYTVVPEEDPDDKS